MYDVARNVRVYRQSMSKTKLKKELSGLTKPQLEELILDLYGARREVKEYFNFYLDPDSEKLRHKYEKKIYSELARGKWRRSTARISRIKTAIKEFQSFMPDERETDNLIFNTISACLLTEKVKDFSDTLVNGTSALVEMYLTRADDNQSFSTAMTRLDGLLRSKEAGTHHFRDYLQKTVARYIQEQNPV